MTPGHDHLPHQQPLRWLLLAGSAALLMTGIWLGDLLDPQAGAALTAPGAVQTSAPAISRPVLQPSSVPSTQMVRAAGQVTEIRRSRRGFTQIILRQDSGDAITVTAMPSLGVPDPAPHVGDAIEVSGLPATYRGEPQVQLEHRRAIRIVQGAAALTVSEAAGRQGPAQVRGNLTSHREYEAKNGTMLLFTLDDGLSGVMFADDWARSDRGNILKLAEEQGSVVVEGKMTTYQGKPSLEAQAMVAAP